jgi:hypothetical protein
MASSTTRYYMNLSFIHSFIHSQPLFDIEKQKLIEAVNELSIEYQLKTGIDHQKERLRVLIPFTQKSDARQQVTNHIVAEVV